MWKYAKKLKIESDDENIGHIHRKNAKGTFQNVEIKINNFGQRDIDYDNRYLNKFDKIIDEIEPGALRMPVLLKKYIKQNARLIAFNVDPLFNNVVDGLIYIRISDIPESTVRPVMEEFQAELERKYGPKKEAIL